MTLRPTIMTLRPTILACLIIAGALTVANIARAELTIHRAEYEAGVLVIHGETERPNENVSLDGRYRTETGPNKQFQFRVRYLPLDCAVNVRAGDDIHPVTISNCDPDLMANPGRKAKTKP